jgi:ferric-dicitrate binding protein FerR (iron transport regulator)
VSPSIEHKGAKFIVYNKSQEIEVTGTEFNIKAYKDDTNIYTTLVEGKVAVSFGDTKQNLMPNQQSNLNLETNSMTTAIVDVYNEISWKEGIFSFDGETLKDIMKVLSRWYDMEVVFENEDISSEEFIGLLRKDQDIEKIISTIKDFGIIKDYEFKGKNLVLK